MVLLNFHLFKIFIIHKIDKISMTDISVNGVCDELQSLGVEGRPVSLFQCQVFYCQTRNNKYPYFTPGLGYQEVPPVNVSASAFPGVTVQRLGEYLERRPKELLAASAEGELLINILDIHFSKDPPLFRILIRPSLANTSTFLSLAKTVQNG